MRVIKRIFFAVFAIVLAYGNQSYAQADINKKFIKKEVRELKKKGYKPLPGYPSIEEQLLSMEGYKDKSDTLCEYIYSPDMCVYEHENLDYAVKHATLSDIDEIVKNIAAEGGYISSDLMDYFDLMKMYPSLSSVVDSVKVFDYVVETDRNGNFHSLVVKHLYLKGEVCGTITETYQEQPSNKSVLVVFDSAAYEIIREGVKPVVGMYCKKRGKYQVVIQQVVYFPTVSILSKRGTTPAKAPSV